MSKYQTSGYGYLLSEWRNDGLFIKADTISSNNIIDVDKSIGPVINEGGYLVVSFTANSSVNLGNTISANCSSIHPSAVFALYYSPEFTEPYVGLPSYSKQEHTLQIWPNPLHSVLNIKKENDPIGKICITDMNGKILLQEIVEEKQTAINVSGLPSGMYFVKTMHDGKIAVEKFIKSSNYQSKN